MRTLTPTERRLLGVFLLAAFLALNAGGVRLWRQVVAGQNRAIAAGEQRLAEGASWVAASEAIGEVGRQLPPLPRFAEKNASSALLGLLRRTAGASGVTILEETLSETPEGLPTGAVAVRLRLSGSFAGCVRFLYEIQQHEAWRSIEQAVIKADATPQNVLAEMEIRQYFDTSPEGSAPADLTEGVTDHP